MLRSIAAGVCLCAWLQIALTLAASPTTQPACVWNNVHPPPTITLITQLADVFFIVLMTLSHLLTIPPGDALLPAHLGLMIFMATPKLAGVFSYALRRSPHTLIIPPDCA